jgi:hypothetical protein
VNGSISTPAKRYVTIEVAALALGVTTKRAYKLSLREGWQQAPATRPKQYLLSDVRRTAEKRRERRS